MVYQWFLAPRCAVPSRVDVLCPGRSRGSSGSIARPHLQWMDSLADEARAAWLLHVPSQTSRVISGLGARPGGTGGWIIAGVGCARDRAASDVVVGVTNAILGGSACRQLKRGSPFGGALRSPPRSAHPDTNPARSRRWAKVCAGSCGL